MFSRMRSEGFSFLSGGLGAGPCSFRLEMGPFMDVHSRDVPDALCPYDWRGSASCGRRFVLRCRGDFRGGRCVGGAVPLGVHSVAELA